MSESPIIKRICEEFCYPVEFFLSRTRHEPLVFRRQIAMLLHVHMGMTTTEVGELFFRCHGTISHAVKTVQDRIETSACDRKEFERIRQLTTP